MDTAIDHNDMTAPLRLVLAVNATTSGLAGVVALAAGGWVDRWLGTGYPGWVRLVGAGLVGFGLAVMVLSRSSDERLGRWTPAVTMADAGWVVASIVTIAAGWYADRGAVVVAAVALMVAAFAITQTRRSSWA